MTVSTFKDLLREENLKRYFDAFDSRVTWPSAKKVEIGGTGYTSAKDGQLKALLNSIAEDLDYELFCTTLPPKNVSEKREWEVVKSEIVNKYIEFSQERLTPILDTTSIRGHVIYNDYKTNDPFLVVDGYATVLHPQSYIESLDKELRNHMRDKPKPFGKQVFNPQRTETHWSESVRLGGEEMRIDTFNLYMAPSFRYLKAKTPTSLDEIDKDLKPYLLNLSNNSEETLHVLLSWMKHCVTRKANTMLVLIGKGATGKTTFARMLKDLVGEDYAADAQAEFFKTRFTSQLTENRVILADEQGCFRQSEMDAAKKYVEDRVASERKGKDAESKPSHASLIVTNNNYNCMAFRPTERKFTVPDVADLPLSKVFPSINAFNSFARRMQEDKRLILFYNYLLAYETDIDRVTGHKGETFWKMVENGNGLTDCEKYILACLKELDESEEESMALESFRRRVTLKLQAGGGKQRCQTSHIVQLLSAYEEAGCPIAEIIECDVTGVEEIVSLRSDASSSEEEEEDFLP